MLFSLFSAHIPTRRDERYVYEGKLLEKRGSELFHGWFEIVKENCRGVFRKEVWLKHSLSLINQCSVFQVEW